MHLKYFIEEFPVGGRLFNFLFQCIKLWGIEKFCKGNIQTIAEHFQCEDFGVIAISVENTFQRRRGNGRNRCQFVASLLMVRLRSSQSCKMRFLIAVMVFMWVSSYLFFFRIPRIYRQNRRYMIPYRRYIAYFSL